MAEQTVEQQVADQAEPSAEEQDHPLAEPSPPAVWGPTEMQAAICDAVRDELEDDELTDEDVAEAVRVADKYVVQGPDGVMIVSRLR